MSCRADEEDLEEFIDYVYEFHGPESDLYPILGVTKSLIRDALSLLTPREGDRLDLGTDAREKVVNIMIDEFGLALPEDY